MLYKNMVDAKVFDKEWGLVVNDGDPHFFH